MFRKIGISFLFALGGSFFSSITPKSEIQELSAQMPNILFISVDDMNDWVGCLQGYPGVQTPHIDQLAAEGILFTNAHCPSPKCGPSRTAILTGLRPSTTGIYDNNQWWKPNLPGVKTIPAYFKENGYRVMGAGKIFHHTAGNNPPEQWHEYVDLVFDDPWDRSRESQKNAYPNIEPTPFPPEIPLNGIRPFQHEFDWGSLDKKRREYGDARSIQWAQKKLKKEFDRPFFLAVGLFHPHLPWYAPKEFFQKYPLEKIQLPDVPEEDLEDVPAVGRELALASSAAFQKVLEADQWKEAVQAYLASISFADYLVGQLLEALAESSYAKNTMVVFWSDHGWHHGQKQHWHKSTLWERSTHVPFIIKAPNLEVGKINPSPVNLVDIYPTLIDYCNLPTLAALDGKSLLPLMKDSSKETSDPSLITYRKGNHALRDMEWRYIQYHDGGEELYHTKRDPHEWYNLASDPSHEELIEKMKQYLPTYNAESKPTKKAFVFDVKTYTWKDR